MELCYLIIWLTLKWCKNRIMKIVKKWWENAKFKYELMFVCTNTVKGAKGHF